VLIELLIVVLIIAALATFYMMSRGSLLGGTDAASPEGKGTTTAGKAREQAQSAVCRNNLLQIRAAISTTSATTGAYPADLDSVSVGVPLSCPVGGEPYDYDASTGQVHCPHPGHESY
jgi:hypothetical protein